MNDDKSLARGLSALAAANADPKVADIIHQAAISGVGIFQILIALASHAGDLAAIYQAILDLINKVKPAPAV